MNVVYDEIINYSPTGKEIKLPVRQYVVNSLGFNEDDPIEMFGRLINLLADKGIMDSSDLNSVISSKNYIKRLTKE